MTFERAMVAFAILVLVVLIVETVALRRLAEPRGERCYVLYWPGGTEENQYRPAVEKGDTVVLTVEAVDRNVGGCATLDRYRVSDIVRGAP